MSLAETAELAAHIQLQGVSAYVGGASKVMAANKSMGASTATLKAAYAVGGDIGKGINNAIRNIQKLGLVAGGFLVSQVKFGIDSLKELEAVTAQTNAVLKSTHGAAGLAAKGIIDLSNKYEDLNATIDNKVIQSAENLLLTFTSIRKNAFEPALKAALDMNQAMGGGEGGLQGTIIQVGKALQDPIRGLTALRRVGVNFSEQQQKQIKDLIKHNKLYEAQQLILKELTKEFGGSFAAAGKTAEGTFASLGDAIEDIQASLATALLPAITDVAKELNTFLRDPATIRGISDFGKSLATGFRDAVRWAKSLDWQAIGGALKTAAGAAKGLIDAFAHAPPWLQQAVVTGWGLNKLTGGAVSNIFGDVLKGLGDNFLSRGSSPANALWVQSVPGVGGGGGPGGALTWGSLMAFLGITIAAQGVANQAAGGPNPYNLPTQQSGFGPQLLDINALKAKQMGSAPVPVIDVSGSADTHSESLRTQMASIDAIRANTVALRANARDIEAAWLKTVDPKDIAARSKAVTGKDATAAQIAAIRTRDEIHQLKVITEKSHATDTVKLERLRALAADAKAHGDTKTAAKVNKAIVDMKAKIAAQEAKTKSQVETSGTAIVASIAANRSDLNVYVTTNITASDVVTTTIRKERMGTIPGTSNNKGTTGGGIN